MSDATPAIFISYAREDSVAADRIAEALRSHGLEVWFDQNELRGGDTWDQKIRGQIRTCTLLIPIISAHTQSRGEGYFRREWKLAAERTHDMATGIPFIVPVVIDDTAESAALVPEEFMKVQWTRLQHGRTTPEFAAQVKRLLDAPRQAASGATAARGSATGPAVMAAAAPRASGVPVWAFAAVGVVALAAIGYVVLRPAAKEVAPAAKPAAEPKAAPVPAAPSAAKVADKSIAVLPFANMSEEKDSAFFADGVHEDILTNLALVPELKVISRTTVTQYRDSKKSMKQIGDELGVAYILEGSVRRVGNKVRVTGQLINARTDEHVWAKSYDKDLTDVFAIQASLSQEIASALQAAITPQAQKFLERRPTENPLAYDSFLKGRDSRNRSRTGQRAPLNAEEAYFKAAVEQDPKFAAAWGELAVTHALNVFWEFDHTPARQEAADAAIGNAVRLAPDAPDVIRALGTYAYYAYRDYGRATEQYEKLARLQPNDPTVFSSLALIQRRQGRWAESLANQRRAIELDPANISYLRNFLAVLSVTRRWDEAIAVQRKLVALLPGELVEQRALAELFVSATGSTKEEAEWFSRLTPAQLNSPEVIPWRKSLAYFQGDLAEIKRLDQAQPYYEGDGSPRLVQANRVAMAFLTFGDPAGARARLGKFPEETRAQLQLEPANARLWTELAFMDLVLGQHDEAIAHARKAAQLIPISRDAYDGTRYAAWLADVLLVTGHVNEAIEEYARLFRLPGMNLNLHWMKRDPFYAPLRANPRGAALLNDPANNAPLF